MRTFFRIMAAWNLLAQLPLALALWLALRSTLPALPLALGLCALALGLWALSFGRVNLLAHDRPVSTLRRRALELPYMAHLMAGWLGVLLLLPLWFLGDNVHHAVIVSALVLLALALYGVGPGRVWLKVERHTIALDKSLGARNSLTIAHWSDVHLGSMTSKERVLTWVAKSNALGADMVVVTGDVISNGTQFLNDIAESMGALRAPMGVYFIPGNHDYFGAGEPLFQLLRDKGVRVLRNASIELEPGLRIVGVDDTWTRSADVPRAFEDARPGKETVLCLVHDPGLAEACANQGADVILCGHTHAGQVAIPFAARLANVGRLAYRYAYGVYRIGRATLYVHPGMGTTGPPVRLGVRPTVALLTVVGKAARGTIVA